MIYIDQMGLTVSLLKIPQKIISLVPSQTELLFALGLDKEIVGITKFCIHPRDKFLSTTKIGGTKKLNIKKILELKPDLIIGNKEENDREQIEELKKYFPVWMSDIVSMEDNAKMISEIGSLVNREQEALKINQEIEQAFIDLKKSIKKTGQKVAYLIWYNPLMIAGKGTFINTLIEYLGYENATKEFRYPVLDFKQLRKLNVQKVFLSSEPFPFKEKHVIEFQKELPGLEVKIVDGEMFSWYGVRMKYAAEYFRKEILV